MRRICGPLMAGLRQRVAELEAMMEIVRCPICNGELSYCGAETADGPTLDCLVCQLRERLAEAEAELADIHESFEQVMDEQCADDERHCTCVPVLRMKLATARGLLREACDECHIIRKDGTHEYYPSNLEQRWFRDAKKEVGE